MSSKNYWVYILASQKNGTLYVGMTNNLERRLYEHKHQICKGFTQKYLVSKLVYFEETDDVTCAIEREKQLKKWPRRYKLNLINSFNPGWRDLSG